MEFPEFVQYVCRHSGPMDEQRELREAFEVFDKNGDGYISAVGEECLITNYLNILSIFNNCFNAYN